MPYDEKCKQCDVQYRCLGDDYCVSNDKRSVITDEFDRLKAENAGLKQRNDWLENERKNIQIELERHKIPEEYQRRVGEAESSILCFLSFTGREMLDVILRDIINARDAEIQKLEAQLKHQ